MGVETAAAIGLVGAGVSAYGQYQSSLATARAAREQARIKRANAAEMIERMEIQEKRLLAQGEEFKAKQINQYAGSGAQIGAGATLIAMEDTNMKITQGIEDMKRDTLFKASQLTMGANFDIQQGGEAIKAGAISAGATLLEGGGRYYKDVYVKEE
jgi:cell division septum initiation protein DivIVA